MPQSKLVDIAGDQVLFSTAQSRETSSRCHERPESLSTHQLASQQVFSQRDGPDSPLRTRLEGHEKP